MNSSSQTKSYCYETWTTISKHESSSYIKNKSNPWFNKKTYLKQLTTILACLLPWCCFSENYWISNETHAFPPGLSRSIPGKEVTFQGCFLRDETDPSRIMVFCCEKKKRVYSNRDLTFQNFLSFFSHGNHDGRQRNIILQGDLECICNYIS